MEKHMEKHKEAREGSKEKSGARYPGGCPIEDHQGYGCNCTQIPANQRK